MAKVEENRTFPGKKTTDQLYHAFEPAYQKSGFKPGKNARLDGLRWPNGRKPAQMYKALFLLDPVTLLLPRW